MAWLVAAAAQEQPTRKRSTSSNIFHWPENYVIVFCRSDLLLLRRSVGRTRRSEVGSLISIVRTTSFLSSLSLYCCFCLCHYVCSRQVREAHFVGIGQLPWTQAAWTQRRMCNWPPIMQTFSLSLTLFVRVCVRLLFPFFNGFFANLVVCSCWSQVFGPSDHLVSALLTLSSDSFNEREFIFPLSFGLNSIACAIRNIIFCARSYRMISVARFLDASKSHLPM